MTDMSNNHRHFSYDDHDNEILQSRQPLPYEPYRHVPVHTDMARGSSPDHGPFADHDGYELYDNQNHAPSYTDVSSSTPLATPAPPPHQYHSGLPLPTDSSESTERGGAGGPPVTNRHWDQGLSYSRSQRTNSSATPGMDNLGESAAGGGIAGIALGVAASNERLSGMQALHAIEDDQQKFERDENIGSLNPYVPSPPPHREGLSGVGAPYPTARGPPSRPEPGMRDPSDVSSHSQSHSHPSRYSLGGAGYMDDPYTRYSTTLDPRVGPAAADFDPNDIEDDGDDGLASHDSRRRSVLSFGRHSSHGILPGVGGGAAAAGGVAAGGTAVAGVGAGGGFKRTLSRLVPGRSGDDPHAPPLGNHSNGQYGPVPGSAGMGGAPEKSEWLNQQTKGNKKMRWLLGILLGILLVGAIVGGIVGGVLASRRNNNNNNGSSRSSPSSKPDKGELNRESSEIKKLLGNSNLRRVFPGMDYTPLNAQYPACLTNMPRQNEVTKDVAVMSQLTNRIRLYGTDCNQTEMVLHAIDALELKDDTKVWLGVWQDKNATTNARQLDHMYRLIEDYGSDRFAGTIVGNEVLFREDMTLTQLATVLRGVKSNFTEKKINLPLATSDLGDDWTKELAAEVDIVMSNVHPFFAGKTAEEATGWTWNFWQTKDVILTKDDPSKRQIISEVGWPSAGGKSCGDSPSCTSSTPGSIAGINEMNKFMSDFVCQGLKNGTEFFWFEAFDEPWKEQYNEPEKNKEWEDKWGLLDVDRNLKNGVKIPDCDGKRIS